MLARNACVLAIRAGAPAVASAADGRVEIASATGRRVRAWRISAAAARAGDGARLRWDLTDAAGRRVAAGVYFARVTLGDVHDTARVVVVR